MTTSGNEADLVKIPYFLFRGKCEIIAIIRMRNTNVLIIKELRGMGNNDQTNPDT